MFLGGLLDGLISSSTGALRAQDGDLHRVLVDVASRRSPAAASTATTRAAVESVDGVAETGGIGLVQLGARVPGNGPRDLASTALFGYELAPSGVPAPPAPGEVYADDVAARRRRRGGDGDPPRPGPHAGHRDRVRLRHDATPVRARCGPSPARGGRCCRPTAPTSSSATTSFQSLVVRTADGADVDRRRRGHRRGDRRGHRVPDDHRGRRRHPGRASSSGRRSTRSSASPIAIAVVVVALFFALLTVERLALYGVLKAIGARSRTLFAGARPPGRRRHRRRRRRRRWPRPRSSTPSSRPARSRSTSPPRRIISSAVLLLVAADRRLRLLPPPGPAGRPGLRDRNSIMSTAALALSDVRKVYEIGDDEVVALDRADLTVERRRDRRARRPLGIGQDDPVLDRRRAAHAHRRRRRRRR